MVGLLDLQTPVNFASPQSIGGPMPNIPKPSGGGLLGMFGGGGGPPGGLTDDQRTRILFAALHDSIASLQGRDAGLTERTSSQFNEDNLRKDADRRRQAVNQALQTAYASGDMNQVRSALMNADPQDVAHITQAMNFGQPKFQEVGGGLYQLPQIGQDGAPKQVIAPAAPKPEATPDSIQIAQSLFPNDPKAQHDYLVKNSPANLRSITNIGVPKNNWQILTDPKSNTQYRYDIDSGKALTLDGSPYTPAGASKIASGGMARSQGAMVMQKYMEEHPDATTEDITRLATSFKSGQSEAGTVGNRAGAADVSAREVSVFAKQALEASTNLPRGEYEALNHVMQTWDTKTSNPQLRRLMIAADALVNARARAISPTGSPHVNDQLEGRKMLSAAFAGGDFAAAVNQMEMEAEGVLSSTKASKDALVEHGSNKPAPKSPLASPANLPRLPAQGKIRVFNPATGKLETQ